MKKLFVFLACGIAAIVLSSCTKSAWDRSYSHKSYVEVGGLKWATKNVGASEDNPYGSLYTYEQAITACPDGWRLPSRTELRMLTQNFSTAVSYDGVSGKWFSGSTPYKEGVEAVFLPYAGGHMHEYDEGQYFDTIGYYWSSTMDSKNSCWFLYFADFSLETSCLFFSSYHKFSVRCIKN